MFASKIVTLAEVGLANNYSIQFDGVDDYVQVITDDTDAIDVTDPFTLSAWIRFTALPGDNPYSVMSNAKVWNQGGYRFTINANESIKLEHHLTGKGYYDNTPVSQFAIDIWYHILVTKSGATVKIYKNGVSLSLTRGGAVTGAADQYNDLQIGAQLNKDNGSSSPRYFFAGYIDEVSIWDTALDADNVGAIYNSGNPIDLTNTSGKYTEAGSLVGYWRFEEGTGTAPIDSSGNGLHAAFASVPTYETFTP